MFGRFSPLEKTTKAAVKRGQDSVGRGERVLQALGILEQRPRRQSTEVLRHSQQLETVGS